MYIISNYLGIFIYLFACLFIYLWLCWVFVAVCRLSLVAASGGYSLMRCVGFSLLWFLFFWSTGSRHMGFGSCGLRAVEHRLSSCGAWPQLLRGMWDLPRPGIEPVSPALAGGFFFFCFTEILFIYFLFLAALGLCCCAWVFYSCGEQGLLFIALHGLLVVVASLVAEHGLQVHGLQQLWHVSFSSCGSRALERRLSSCGARAQLLHGMWDLHRLGLKPMSSALAGGFLTTAPPGKFLFRQF